MEEKYNQDDEVDDDDDDVGMTLVEEARARIEIDDKHTSSSFDEEENANINSILNPAGPRLASQKRERSFVIFIITLIVLSIVVAATPTCMGLITVEEV